MDDEYHENIVESSEGFTFAVGFADSLRSRVWSIGTSKKSRDVYLYISAFSKVAKISFHESCKFQYSLHDMRH